MKKRKKYGGDRPANSPKSQELNSLPVSSIQTPTRVAILNADYKRLEARREAAMNTILECDPQIAILKAELQKLGTI